MPLSRKQVRPVRRVVVLAPAKINLGLEILFRRPDGYHEVTTLLQALRLSDTLEIRTSPDPGTRLSITPRGLDLGPAEENLVIRAARLLGIGPSAIPGLDFLLTKRIPVGAGLGGGSADAAAALVGLSLLQGGKRSPEILEELGGMLGSDVPFFIRGGTKLGLGRGERLRPAPLWPPRWVVLVFPHRILSTRSVYEKATFGLTPSGPLSSISSSGFPRMFWSRMESVLRNDLEPAAVELEPAIGCILKEFHRLGSSFSRVTGSGSAVFGVAPERKAAAAWAERFAEMGHWSKVVRPARGGCVIRHC